MKDKKIKRDKAKHVSVILEITIDYPELIKLIEENSLEKHRKVTKEELGIWKSTDNGMAHDEERRLLRQYRKVKSHMPNSRNS